MVTSGAAEHMGGSYTSVLIPFSIGRSQAQAVYRRSYIQTAPLVNAEAGRLDRELRTRSSPHGRVIAGNSFDFRSSSADGSGTQST